METLALKGGCKDDCKVCSKFYAHEHVRMVGKSLKDIWDVKG